MLAGAVLIALLASVIVYQFFPAPKASGIWHGTFDINGRGNYNLDMLQIGGRLVGISSDAKVAYNGTAELDGRDYSATFKMYFINRNDFETADITGQLIEPGRIDARFTTRAAGDTGRLRLRYQSNNYERDVGPDDVAGAWILYQGYRIIKLDVDEQGGISGSDTDGCGFEGQIKPVEAQRNAYKVALVASSCDRVDGQFNGFAWLQSSVKPDDTLHIQVFREDWNMMLPMVRNDDTRIIDDGKKPI